MPSVRSDVPLVTPDGWKLAGELRPDDFVFSATGHATRVSGIGYERPAGAIEAKMVLDPFVVSEDHDVILGLPWYGHWIGPISLLPEREKRLVHPLAQIERIELQLPDLDLPLDPWTYGYWRVLHLPDGTIAVPEDLAERAVGLLESAGLSVSKRFTDQKLTYLTSPDLALALEKIGEHPGFHPDYLRSGAEQRRALLSGVVDARGRFMNGVTVETARPVVEQVAEIAMSLGLRSSMPNRGLPRVRMSPHDAVMTLRAEELHKFLHGPDRPGFRMEVPYMIRRASRVPPGDFVVIKTVAGTYLLGRPMIPVRDH